ncbi:MAG: DedA family protein [Candidatus Rokubacteria bacterium]|nr:DedA family protein [Candidatus Rokubacteria bacterium]
MGALFGWVHGLYEWTISWAGTPHGTAALGLIAFAESSFFPIPPDVLLIALALGRPDLAFWYATVSTAGSVAGGAAGYGIGYWGGRPVVEWLFGRSKVELVHRLFQRYEAWAVGIAGFTPIPYKVFTIGAGVFYVKFPVFLVASALSRGARFFLVAALLFTFGPPIREFVERYFEWLTVLLVVGIIGGFVVLRHLVPRAVGAAARTGRG